MYGRGKYCPATASAATSATAAATATREKANATSDHCLALNDLEPVMAKSRDNAALLDAWRGWHAIAPPMKAKYQRFVGLLKYAHYEAHEGKTPAAYQDTSKFWIQLEYIW